MKYWFGSTAYLRVASYMRRDDAETAFNEAVARLRKEYGEKRDTAEDMLAIILEGDTIEGQEQEAICEFMLMLEEVYTLAVETDRDTDFNRDAIYKKVLASKLPCLRNKWAWHLTKRGLKKPKFEDLLSFPTEDRRYRFLLSLSSSLFIFFISLLSLGYIRSAVWFLVPLFSIAFSCFCVLLLS